MEDIMIEMSDGCYDIVGLTAVTSTYQNAVEIARRLKEDFPKVPIILGGIHATVDPINCVNEGVFDFIVVGEGEYTLVELVDAILSDNKDYSSIKGLVYSPGQKTPRLSSLGMNGRPERSGGYFRHDLTWH
jgi:radical SAM superfamily enzyme YgiQ (UPF0313 family)